MAKLTDIEGIGPAFAEKLQGAGIGSIESFLKICCTSQGRKEIEAKSGIDHSRILRFVNHADLMRIKGVGGEYSELLEAAGVDTVPELAQRNAANLHAKMAEVNADKKLVRQLPGAGQVAGWVAQAKGMPRVVSH
jgi:predicted flap endonuclease-1-like 5' DNA nuclease